MNKKDFILIITILTISLIFLLPNKINSKTKKAIVYYDNEIIMQIPLDKKTTYTVEGYLGEVIIETDINKVRISKETSNYHLCSKQGYVSNAIPLICLPNKVVVQIKEENIDTIIG